MAKENPMAIPGGSAGGVGGGAKGGGSTWRGSPQWTFTAKANDGSWSGSVTPLGAKNFFDAKRMASGGGTYTVDPIARTMNNG